MKKVFAMAITLMLVYSFSEKTQYALAKRRCIVTSVYKVGDGWDMTIEPVGNYMPVDSAFAHQKEINLYCRMPVKVDGNGKIIIKE